MAKMARSKMTGQIWLGVARHHRADLIDLIEKHHPRGAKTQAGSMRITAPAAESASRAVRRMIRDAESSDPVALFKSALDAGNHRLVARVLNDTWFGVPESADCWQLPGFRVAVSLLDDPPDADAGALSDIA